MALIVWKRIGSLQLLEKMMVLVRGYTNAEGSERLSEWQPDEDYSALTMGHSPSSFCYASAAIPLGVQGTGSKIQQQMLRHLANFKMSLTLTVFFSPHVFLPLSWQTDFSSVARKKRNSTLSVESWLPGSCYWYNLKNSDLNFIHSLIPKSGQYSRYFSW